MANKHTSVEDNISWVEQSVGPTPDVYCPFCETHHRCPGAYNHKPTITKFYRVQKVVNGVKRSKSFSPKKLGSKKKALVAARKFRNSL